MPFEIKNIKNITVFACACAVVAAPVFVYSNMETEKQASVVEVFADNNEIAKVAQVMKNETADKPDSPSIEIIEEKLADLSQKYTERYTGKYIKSKKADVFSRDTVSSEKIKTLDYGEYVIITGDDVYNKDGWYRILLPNGSTGYILKKHLTDEILFEACNAKKYVNDDIPVYKGIGMKKDILTIHKNDIVTIVGTNDELNIYKIKTESGKTGHIYHNNTSEEMVFTEEETVSYSKKNDNPVYSSYDKNSDIIRTFQKHNGIRIVGFAKNWVKVRLNNDRIGYMETKTFTDKCPQAKKAVAYAYSLLGTPYVWGGQSPQGTDCSGMTLQCYAHAGIAIPRTAATQYYCGVKLEFDQAKPGDLLIWAGHNDGRITHVGMYVGNDTMIHASSTHHQVVETSASKYMTHSQLMGVIRVIGHKDGD